MPERDLPDLHVRLFGGPILLRGDEEVPISPFQSFLLALVFGHGPRGLSRAKAAWLLWEEDDNRTTRHRLSQLTYTISQRVGGHGPIVIARSRLKGTGAVASVDLDTFHRSCNTATLKIEGSVRDPRQLFERITEPPTPSYDHWISASTATAVQRRLKSLTKQWDHAEEAGDWAQATIACAALLRLCPDDVRLTVDLARLQLRSGEIRAARLTASRALALDPAALTEDARLQHLLTSRGMSRSPPAPRDACSTIVGRSQPIATLFDQLLNPETVHQPVFVTGESGIGKSRLCEEVLERLVLLGVRVLPAQCAEFESNIALNPVIEALQSADCERFASELDEPWRSVLESILPGLSPSGPPPRISESAVPRRLFEALRRLLHRVAADCTTVLFIDDFQWIDQTSIAALHYLLRRWEGDSLRVLLACRSEALLSGAHEVSRFVGNCIGGGATHVQLQELSFGEARELMNARTAQAIPEETAKLLFRRAGGNPLFLVELAAAEHGRSAGGAPALPDSVNMAVEARFSQASELLQTIVRVLALAGPTDVATLSRVSGVPPMDVARGLDDGVERGLLRDNSHGHFMLRHEVVGDVARALLRPAATASLHAAIADVLHKEHGRAAADRIALHLFYGGQTAAAFEFAVEAADRAELNGATPEAIQFLEIALECTSSHKVEAHILGRIARHRFRRTEMGLAAPLLTLASERHRDLGLRDKGLRFAVEQYSALSEAGLLDHRKCIVELSKVEREAREMHLEAVVVSCLEAKIRIWERLDRPDEVRYVLGAVRALAREFASDAAAEAHMLLALEIFYGDPAVACRSTLEATRLAQASELPEFRLKAALRRFLVLIYMGTAGSGEGTSLMASVHEESRRAGDLRLKHTALVNEGCWRLEVRDLACAEQLFREAQGVISGIPTPHDEIHHLGNLGATYLEMGDPAKAEQYFRRAQTFVDSGVRRVAVYFLQAGLGLSLARQGKIREARRISRELPLPTSWYFDPTYPALLRAEILRAEQNPRAALQLLANVSDDIRGRMVPQWLTLQEALIRLTRRTDSEWAKALATEARKICLDCELLHRAGAFTIE